MCNLVESKDTNFSGRAKKIVDNKTWGWKCFFSPPPPPPPPLTFERINFSPCEIHGLLFFARKLNLPPEKLFHQATAEVFSQVSESNEKPDREFLMVYRPDALYY